MRSSDVGSRPACLIAPLLAIVALAAVITSANLAASQCVVTVIFPADSADVLEDAVRIDVETAFRRLPRVSEVACGASATGEAMVIVIFKPGTDSKAALLSVHSEFALMKERLPQLIERGEIVVHQDTASPPLTIRIVSSDSAHDENFLHNYCLINILPEINRLPGIGDTMLTSTARRYRFWVEMDPASLQAHNATPDDIVKATEPSGIIPRRTEEVFRIVESTPESITYLLGNSRYAKPEQYENIILKANAEGEIVRLKDIGKVKWHSLWHDRDLKAGEKAWAAIILTRLPDASTFGVSHEVKEKLREISETSSPKGITFEVSERFPFNTIHGLRQ